VHRLSALAAAPERQAQSGNGRRSRGRSPSGHTLMPSLPSSDPPLQRHCVPAAAAQQLCPLPTCRTAPPWRGCGPALAARTPEGRPRGTARGPSAGWGASSVFSARGPAGVKHIRLVGSVDSWQGCVDRRGLERAGWPRMPLKSRQMGMHVLAGVSSDCDPAALVAQRDTQCLVCLVLDTPACACPTPRVPGRSLSACAFPQAPHPARAWLWCFQMASTLRSSSAGDSGTARSTSQGSHSCQAPRYSSTVVPHALYHSRWRTSSSAWKMACKRRRRQREAESKRSGSFWPLHFI
jgi:hypothetical protein